MFFVYLLVSGSVSRVRRGVVGRVRLKLRDRASVSARVRVRDRDRI